MQPAGSDSDDNAKRSSDESKELISGSLDGMIAKAERLSIQLREEEAKH